MHTFVNKLNVDNEAAMTVMCICFTRVTGNNSSRQGYVKFFAVLLHESRSGCKIIDEKGWDRFVDMDQVSEKYGKVCEMFPASAVLQQPPLSYHFRMKIMP